MRHMITGWVVTRLLYFKKMNFFAKVSTAVLVKF